jgi:hypothetical protein
VSNLYTGPSIDASYQVSDNLAKRFQRRRFIEIDQSKTRVAYGSWLSWYFQRTKFSTAVCTRHITRDVINKNESDEKRINRQLILYHSTKIDFNESKCTLRTKVKYNYITSENTSNKSKIKLYKKKLGLI